MGSPRLRTVIVNSLDPSGPAHFWSSFLNVDIQRGQDEAEIIWIDSDSPGGVNLGFQRVAAKPEGANQLHLDVSVDDLDEAQVVVEGLGGALVKVNRLENGFEWRVLADSDGNHFCVFVDH